MTLSEKLHFYKELYFEEFEKREKIFQNINIWAGYLVLLISAGFYLAINFHFHGIEFTSFYFCISLSFFIILWTISLYYIYKSLMKDLKSCGYDTHFIANTLDLEKYFKEYTIYLRKNGSRTPKDDTLKHFENFLIEKLSDASSKNREVYELKNQHFKEVKKHTVYTTIALFATSILYLINFIEYYGS